MIVLLITVKGGWCVTMATSRVLVTWCVSSGIGRGHCHNHAKSVSSVLNLLDLTLLDLASTDPVVD